MIATTINYKTIQVKITEFDIDWDYNPWDMPPDYDLEREMRHSIFEVEVDPSYPDDGDENRQCILMIREKRLCGMLYGLSREFLRSTPNHLTSSFTIL